MSARRRHSGEDDDERLTFELRDEGEWESVVNSSRLRTVGDFDLLLEDGPAVANADSPLDPHRYKKNTRYKIPQEIENQTLRECT